MSKIDELRKQLAGVESQMAELFKEMRSVQDQIHALQRTYHSLSVSHACLFASQRDLDREIKLMTPLTETEQDALNKIRMYLGGVYCYRKIGEYGKWSYFQMGNELELDARACNRLVDLLRIKLVPHPYSKHGYTVELA